MGVIVRQKIKGDGNPYWIFIAKNNKRTSMMIGNKEEAEKVASHLRTQMALEIAKNREVVANQIKDNEIIKAALIKRAVTDFDRFSLPDKMVIPILKKQKKPITPETIEIKRQQLIMKRTLKEFKLWRKNNESNHTDVHGKQLKNEKNHGQQLQAG